jgi:SAM-dependent methyltransferase
MRKLTTTDSGQVWRRMPPQFIPGSLPLPEEFLAAAPLARRILDVGCGTGVAADEANSVAAWLGIDINSAAIRTARKVRRRNVKFLIHDARQPLRGLRTFDLILLKGVLTCLPTHEEQLSVLRNTVQRAATRRVIVIIDFLQNWTDARYKRRYDLGERRGLEKGTFFARDNAIPTGSYLAHHFEYPELVRLLTAAGLRSVCFREVPVRTRSGNKIHGFVLTAE